MNQDIVKSIFEYKDGSLYWRNDRGSNAKKGNRAGRLLHTGYRGIQVSGKKYQEHRLIYLYHHGYMPAQIDHINRIKNDNRVENLREADHSNNQMNTSNRNCSSGYRGVRKARKEGHWQARICHNGEQINLGIHPSKECANAAYKEAAKKLYGEFAE